MNRFEYKIYDTVYEDMASGKKMIEFRLLNDKSKRIKNRDEIKFYVVNNKDKAILVEVIDKYFYDNIDDLYNHKEHLSTIRNYTKEELKDAFYNIFGKEKVDSSKIVGIKFKVKKVYNTFDFADEINYLEELSFNEDYIIRKGRIPILFTAPHTMEQKREDGTIKHKETYTKAIALYLNKYFNVNCMIKINDTGVESNRDGYDEFKTQLMRFVKENDIKIVIDLHGSKKERNYDIEFGTLNNLTADYSTINELEEAFKENKILNVVHNDPFKGGAITRNLYSISNVEVIQLEINKNYRDSNDIKKVEILIESLKKFIKQYDEYTKNRSVKK